MTLVFTEWQVKQDDDWVTLSDHLHETSLVIDDHFLDTYGAYLRVLVDVLDPDGFVLENIASEIVDVSDILT